MPLLEYKTAEKALKELKGLVGTLEKLEKELLAQPEKAARELARALGEVHKTCKAILSAVDRYVRIGVTPEELRASAKVLAYLESPKLSADVANASGHSSLIKNIFETHLNKWFERVFRGGKLAAARKVFTALSDADAVLFARMRWVCEVLREEAKVAYDLVSEGKFDEARKHVLGRRQKLRRYQDTLANIMDRLVVLRNDCIVASRVTRL
jgi:hypothetical protein